MADRFLPDGFCACPVDIAFDVVGKKWTVLIIRNLLRGQSHFGEFVAGTPGLSPRTLSARLKELEQKGLVLKRVSSARPLSVDYVLTEKGHAVLPILEQMVRWSIAWAPDRIFDNGKDHSNVEACFEEWESVLLAGELRGANGPAATAEGRNQKRNN